MNSAPSLVDLQAAFYQRVLHDDPAILPWVVDGGIAANQRMQVYQHIVENTLFEALHTSYPVIALLVGDRFFHQTADQYMRKYPPQNGNLQAYGAHFSNFLMEMKTALSLPYLPDIARLEWARQQSYLAADGKALVASEVGARLQAVEDGAMHLILHPSVQLLVSDYRIFEIWHYCMEHDAAALDLAEGGQSMLLWRDGSQIVMQVIDAAAAVWIDHILQGMRMDEALAQQDTDGIDLSALLPFLTANQMIISMETNR